MIVPFGAGGPADTLARVMAQHMGAALGQTVVVENATGAAGTLGVGRLVRSQADGYTIGLGNWGTHVLNGALYPLTYDLLSDLEPIALLPSEAMVVTARKDFPANTMQELIAWLKQNPDKATKGTSGVGGPGHIAGIFLQQQTGTRFQLIPYRGGGPAMQDVVAGQIDLAIAGASIATSLAQSGAVKAYAVASPKRLATAPNIPTADEAGVPGFYMTVWHGLWAPKGTPKEIVAKLSAAAQKAMDAPQAKERFASLGQDLPAKEQQTSAALAAFHKSEIEKWWPIVQAANISIKAE
jgi:tripartite-type tricarboxylate transporter receptor subunit TctC